MSETFVSLFFLDYNSLNPNLQKVKFSLKKIPSKNPNSENPNPKIPNPTSKNATSKTLRIGELRVRAGNSTKNPTRQLGNKEAGKLGADAINFRKLESCTQNLIFTKIYVIIGWVRIGFLMGAPKTKKRDFRLSFLLSKHQLD